MSNSMVCDRCNNIQGRDCKTMYELNIELVDPDVSEPEDNVLFWAHMDVCEKCKEVVLSLLSGRIVTTMTPADVFGPGDHDKEAFHAAYGSVASGD